MKNFLSISPGCANSSDTMPQQLRDQRKEDLESHIAAVNTELKRQNAILNGESNASVNGSEFAGFDSAPQEAAEVVEEQLPSDEEYIDEDRYTTVTVEPMGEEVEDGEEEQEEKNVRPTEEHDASVQKDGENLKKRPWAKGKDGDKKFKKKKFRYETKAERAFTRQKQKSKNRVAKARRKGD